MEAKVSITTKCNGRCSTCPVWSIPGETMSLERWRAVWVRLVAEPDITWIMLNNTGDIYCEPNHGDYLEIVHRQTGKAVCLTTNAIALDMVPDVDNLIISFNGGTKETYERTVGASFDDTVRNIRAQYAALARLPACEIHCLMYDGNAGTERDLIELWKDFPGRVRLSYKYDNQMREDRTIERFRVAERIPCDYLQKLCIIPSGKLISCAHDFGCTTDFGNFLTDSMEMIRDNKTRALKVAEHQHGEWLGLCEKCNYNAPLKTGRIFYVK